MRTPTMQGRPAPTRVRIDSRRRWFPDLSELLRYRQLVYVLGRRNVTVRYRQTILGTIWIFVGPLVSAFLFSFVFGRVAKLDSGGHSYFLFSYVALLAWNLFSQSLSAASTSLTGNTALITKIYFPRLVIPISTTASVLVNAAISFGVTMIMLVTTSTPLTLRFLLLPVWLSLAMMLASGIAFALASVSVLYRDINYLTPLLIQFLLYLSPVGYSVEVVPENLRNFYLLNPVASIVEGCRWSLLGGGYLPPAWSIAYSAVVCVAAVAVGMSVFARREPGFADVV